MLAEMDAEIIIANSLEEAVRIDRVDHPAVTLLDLNLVPGSPTETTICNIKHFQSPVIVLTGMPDDGLLERSFSAGAKGFFHKLDAIAHPDKFRDEIRKLAKP